MAAVRSYRGVRFRHQGRNPRSSGIDCAGMAECSYSEAGMRLRSRHDYRKLPRIEEARRGLVANLGEARHDRQDGDVLLFGLGRHGRFAHFGILDGSGFWHVEIHDRVRFTALAGTWRGALVGIFGVR